MGHEKPPKGTADTAGDPKSKTKQQWQVEDIEKASIDDAKETSNFRNGFHEILFVWIVTSAQWMSVRLYAIYAIPLLSHPWHYFSECID